jgi:hypothetical protein
MDRDDLAPPATEIDCRQPESAPAIPGGGQRVGDAPLRDGPWEREIALMEQQIALFRQGLIQPEKFREYRLANGITASGRKASR